MARQQAPLRDRIVLLAGSHLELPLKARYYLEERYRVLAIRDDTTAMEWIQRHVPDLVIADLTTACVDDYALCRAIVDDRLLTSVSILLLASARSNEAWFTALQKGADDCLAKPINVDRFRARVDNLIARSRRIREALAMIAPGSTLLTPNRMASSAKEVVFLRQVEDTIDANLDNEQFNIRLLARSMATGRAHLYRQLKTLGNISPGKLILDRRLQRAASLLTNERTTVTEVAYAAGFKSLSHFSRSFRKHLGVTPRAYLKGNTS
jgi:AraC-like DNA-binding protein